MRPTPSRRLALPLVTLALAACSEESPKNRRSDREREPGAEVAKSASSSEPKASSSSAAPAAPPSSATAAASATAAPSASAPSKFGGEPPAMIRIEAGRFKMGSDDGEPDEKPVHEVEVAAFDLDRTEVTVEDYRRCVEAKVCTEPGTGNRSSYWMNDPSLPVNYIDSKQAEQFCAWNGEKRLPTEEEWEFAARGPEGRRFAWGDTPPDLSVGCWGGRPILREQGPCPVGSFPSTNTPNGLADMTGNLWEWTSSGYAFVYEKPRDNSKRVYRGGSWDDSYTLAPKRQREYVERATRRFRNLPTIRGPMVGVRCAKSV